jgi:PAS domain S-box-containing protein
MPQKERIMQERIALRRYELLSELTRDIVLFLRPDGQIVEANRAATRTYGYSHAELLGMRIHDLRAEAFPPMFDEQMAQSAGDGITFETKHRRKDGTVFPVEVSSTPSPIGGVLLNLVRDITVRKQVETTRALLREIDQRILERQPLPVILQTMCEQLSELFGYSLVWIGLRQPDGTVGMLAHAGAAQEFLREVSVRWDELPEGHGPTGTAIRTGQVQVIPVTEQAWRPFRAPAAHHGFKVALSLPLNVKGETIGALTFYAVQENAFDAAITEELGQFANQVAISILAARDQEEIGLRTAALDAAANAVVITDREGRILWVNRAFTELTGYSSSEALQQSPRVLKSGQHDAAFYQTLWETIAAGRIWRGEICNRRKDGTLYTEEMTITPVRAAGGEITHFIAIKQCRR